MLDFVFEEYEWLKRDIERGGIQNMYIVVSKNRSKLVTGKIYGDERFADGTVIEMAVKKRIKSDGEMFILSRDGNFYKLVEESA